MHRRSFLTTSLGVAAALALPYRSWARQATPVASPIAGDLPMLQLTLTDTGFEIAQPLQAGRYAVTVTNAGTSVESHFGLGKIPDEITDEQYQAWIAAEGEDTDALSFEKIGFVGVPDWPQPGGQTTGVIDLASGRYFLFDPFGARGVLTLQVEGAFAAAPEPAADLTVTLKEMAIELPEAAFTGDAVTWRIENIGAISHEVAVIPVAADFTEETLHTLMMLPEDATPPPGTPEFIYMPVAAIGILGPGHTSWLNVQLSPGRYLAVCMLPFGTGYPHVMDGMYRFFDVE